VPFDTEHTWLMGCVPTVTSKALPGDSWVGNEKLPSPLLVMVCESLPLLSNVTCCPVVKPFTVPVTVTKEFALFEVLLPLKEMLALSVSPPPPHPAHSKATESICMHEIVNL
jgi:hypothetical protein